jgi:L-ascorbate oxidase
MVFPFARAHITGIRPQISLGVAIVIAALACPLQAARAVDFKEPAVFASSGGVLDLLMIARQLPISSISFSPPSGRASVNPVGWIYEVCQRPSSVDQCPMDTNTVSDYGGVRLALRAGDILKIRLVNKLPLLDKAKVKHVAEPGLANLFRNPTNLHTHGLIVPPRTPTLGDPTFGDYVFVEIYNSANGIPEPQPFHQHGLVKMDFVDYRIEIPSSHPSGLFWYHPHVHGLSLNQVSSGMAGLISIGEVKDYVAAAPATIRHLILKDIQVLAAGTLTYDSGAVTVVDGEVQNQQIADFCEQIDKGGPNSRQGYCEGQPDEHATGNSFIGSRWYFTINGQVFPTIRVASPDGEIWRLTNASAQVSYRINLVDDSTQMVMSMQLVALDGISITVPPGTPPGTLLAMGGNKFTLADCASGSTAFLPVCIRDLIMMPSSRAEMWVAYRNSSGSAVTPPPAASATLRQEIINLGPAAEAWPQIKLAKVEFAYGVSEKVALDVSGNASAAFSPKGVFEAKAVAPGAAPSATACHSLPSGHHRRIFFGIVDPADQNSHFGIGYEEVDQSGVVVSGTQIGVSSYDPTRTTVCLPLGLGGSLVHETWELVNLGTETHNFHIHQTKFRVLDAASSVTSGSAVILEDNIPLPFGIANIPDIADKQSGYCTIEQWRSGQCIARPIVIDIPFFHAGEFLFHCHILEHEDGGMMAKIVVEPH